MPLIIPRRVGRICSDTTNHCPTDSSCTVQTRNSKRWCHETHRSCTDKGTVSAFSMQRWQTELRKSLDVRAVLDSVGRDLFPHLLAKALDFDLSLFRLASQAGKQSMIITL